jgi:hypothetical protein
MGAEQSENDLAYSGTFIQPALCQHIVVDIGVAPENAAPVHVANILDDFRLLIDRGDDWPRGTDRCGEPPLLAGSRLRC